MKFIKCVFVIIEKNLGSILIASSIVIAAVIYANFNPYENCKRDISYYVNNDAITIARVCSGSGS